MNTLIAIVVSAVVGIGLGYGFRGFIRRELAVGQGMAINDFLKIKAEIAAIEKQLKDALLAEVAKL